MHMSNMSGASPHRFDNVYDLSIWILDNGETSTTILRIVNSNVLSYYVCLLFNSFVVRQSLSACIESNLFDQIHVCVYKYVFHSYAPVMASANRRLRVNF